MFTAKNKYRLFIEFEKSDTAKCGGLHFPILLYIGFYYFALVVLRGNVNYVSHYLIIVYLLCLTVSQNQSLFHHILCNLLILCR